MADGVSFRVYQVVKKVSGVGRKRRFKNSVELSQRGRGGLDLGIGSCISLQELRKRERERDREREKGLTCTERINPAFEQAKLRNKTPAWLGEDRRDAWGRYRRDLDLHAAAVWQECRPVDYSREKEGRK